MHSYDHEDVKTITDVGKSLLDQVEAFFISYNTQRGKAFKIVATSGPKNAVQLLKTGIQLFESTMGGQPHLRR